MAEDLNDEQVLQALSEMAETATVQEEKHNAHRFLNEVATTEDTTRVGFLKEEEVGIPKLSTRTLKELALYSRDIAGDEAWAKFFDKRSEIITSTSLSKEAKLLDLAVVSRREVANVSPQRPRVQNKRWFKKKEPSAEL